MPKQISSHAILLAFFLLGFHQIFAQCSITLNNPNQPLINIVTNSSCEAEFQAAPFIQGIAPTCTVLYFKDLAMTLPFSGIPTFNNSNLGQLINIYVTADDGNPSTPLPTPVLFQVKVVDTTIPNLICPASFSETAPSGTCALGIPNGLNATVFDNCGGGINMTWTTTGATILAGNNSPNGLSFNVGNTVINYKATDFSGNTATCSTTISIGETTPPSLVSCPSSLTLDAPTGTCERIVVSGLTPSFTDNCSQNINLSYSVSGITNANGQGSANGLVFKVGTSIVSYVATDFYGNANSGCFFNVTIKDIDKPTIICPIDLTVNTIADSCFTYISPTNLTPVRFDNCGQNNVAVTYKVNGATQSNTLPLIQIANQKFYKGQNTITFTATDASGNSNVCTMNVLINDKTKPKITCNNLNINELTAAGSCQKAMVFSQPSYSDNCSSTPQLVLTYEIKGLTNANGNGFVPIGQVFNTGKSVLTYKVLDTDGNANFCSFNVFLKEFPAVKPKLVCRTDTMVLAETGKCNRLINNGLAPKSATDNCTAASDLTLLVSFSGATTMSDTSLSVTKGANGFTFNTGTTTLRYILQDASGNADTAFFKILVKDIQKPVITCTSDVTASAGQKCNVKIPNLQPTATDNCSPNNLVFSYQISGATQVQNSSQIIDSVRFNVGVSTVKFFVKDASSNTDSCTFKVTVTENIAPSITCTNDLTVSTSDSTCTAFLQNIPLPIVSDNCDLATNLKLSFTTSGATTLSDNGNVNGKIFEKGTTIVTYKVSDFSNNETTCSFKITVKDTKAPKITCPSNITVNTLDSTCYAILNGKNPIFSDNCSATLSYNISGQTTGNGNGIFTNIQLSGGQNKITYKATDLEGNTATCFYNIYVKDAIAPKITCPANVTAHTGNDNCIVSLSNLDPLTSDNCTVLNLNFSSSGATIYNNEIGSASNKVFENGLNNITYKIIDGQGNLATCNFTLTVLDITQPIISCKSKIEKNLDNTGNLTVDASIFDLGSFDNCTPNNELQFSLSKSNFDCSNIGDNALIFNVKDKSGNISSCNTLINVKKSINNLGFSISSSTVDETFWGHANGKINLNMTGGVGTFSYLWSNGKTSKNLADLAAGDYEVTVTDNVSKCVGKAIVKINAGEKLTLNASQTIAKIGEIVTIPVRVQHFVNVTDLSFSLRLNSLNIAEILGVQDFALPNIDSTNYSFQKNRVTFKWENTNGGTSLQNGTALFFIKAKIIGKLGEFTPFVFEAIPMPVNAKINLLAGNTDVPLNLQNGSIGVSNGNLTADLTSNFNRENGLVVGKVSCILTGTNKDSTVCNSLGGVKFTLPMGTKAIIKPYRNDAHKNGCTASDLVMMQRHILGTAYLSSNYKKIAADINKNGSITAADLTELRYLLLGTINVYNKNTSWRFVPASYTFPSMGINQVLPFPDSLIYDYLLDNQLDKNFIAMKIGDVNLSATNSANGNATDRTDKVLNFFTENKSVEAGQEVEIFIKNQNKIKVEALDLTLNFDAKKLTYRTIFPSKNNTFTAKDINEKEVLNGQLKLVNVYEKGIDWQENTELVKLVFTANEKIESLEELLSFEESTIFANDEEANLELIFTKKKLPNGTFSVSNITPNPTKDFATIPIITTEKGILKTTVFDLEGRVVLTQNQEIFREFHEVKIDFENLQKSIYIVENQLNGYINRQKIVVH